MGSSYTWCNSYKVTIFLHRRFLKDLMVEKNIIKCYYFPSDNLINTTIFFSLPLFIAFHLLKGTPHTTIFKNLQNTNSFTEEHLAIARYTRNLLGWHCLQIKHFRAVFLPNLITIYL